MEQGVVPGRHAPRGGEVAHDRGVGLGRMTD